MYNQTKLNVYSRRYVTFEQSYHLAGLRGASIFLLGDNSTESELSKIMFASKLTAGSRGQFYSNPRKKVAFVDPQSNNSNKRGSATVFSRPRLLVEAVTQGRLLQIRLLLDAGVNVNCKDLNGGQTALIRAMFLDDIKLRRRIAKVLLNYGAKVKLFDDLGRSALSWACMLGREDMVTLFFSLPKVDLALENVDINGNTNLMLACMSGNVNIVETLSRAFRTNRLDVNKVNNQGESALTIAHENEFGDCLGILLNEGHVKSFSHETKIMRDVHSATGMRPRQKRNKSHTGLRENCCYLPRLFDLYTEQLTNSYPKKGR